MAATAVAVPTSLLGGGTRPVQPIHCQAALVTLEALKASLGRGSAQPARRDAQR